MKAISIIVSFTFVLLSSLALASPVETYTFSDEVSKTRYQALVKELRCPKCQNQNLADSNSQIAVDLRQEVYEMIQQNKSDKEIVDFMVERYGEFVLYRPKVSSLTYILWFGPAVLLLLGVFIVVFILKRKAPKEQKQALSAEQKAKLEQILKDK